MCVAGPGQCSNLCRRESSRRSLTWLESDDEQADEHFEESSAVATVDWSIVPASPPRLLVIASGSFNGN